LSKARILAVDDQLYFRVFLEDLLSKEGFEVVTASSGAEALERFAEGSFDLVLTDLVMPEMDGSQLVQRLKEQRPEQDVIVVTSVGDVKTAVDAMKIGAVDYLLKPIDAAALIQAIEAVLDCQRLREDHGRLLAENLEYMGAFALYERALGLFASLTPEALADRIAEVLCLETNAHGGVVWVARGENPERLGLACVRGVVRIETETEELDLSGLPPELAPLADADEPSFFAEVSDAGEDAGRLALFVPLRQAGRLLAAVRLTDKLDGGEFDAADRSLADRLAPFAAQAMANAMRFRALDRRSFRDTTTGAYTKAYFDDVIQHEIQKAGRFGRTFSLLRIVLDPASTLRGRIPGDFSEWIEAVTQSIGRAVRTTDLLACESEGQFCVMLSETDTIGAAALKRRIRTVVERDPEMRDLEAENRPVVLTSAATFPSDGKDAVSLDAVLATRIEEDRNSVVRALGLETTPFRGLVDALLAEARPGRPETAEQMTRLLLSEVGARPERRGLLFVAPGASLQRALQDGLEHVRGLSPKTEIVLVADRKSDTLSGLPVTWLSPVGAGTACPFLLYYSEGSAYALIRDELVEDGATSYFHTSDPVMVEHLTFQLGRDLGFPIGG